MRKIEGLINDLRQDATITLIRRDARQAGSRADPTAFFSPGGIVDVERPAQISTVPPERRARDYTSGRFG